MIVAQMRLHTNNSYCYGLTHARLHPANGNLCLIWRGMYIFFFFFFYSQGNFIFILSFVRKKKILWFAYYYSVSTRRHFVLRPCNTTLHIYNFMLDMHTTHDLWSSPHFHSEPRTMEGKLPYYLLHRNAGMTKKKKKNWQGRGKDNDFNICHNLIVVEAYHLSSQP